MEKQEVLEKVKDIIKPYVKNQEAFDNIANETKIVEDLRINSARVVDIILAFEDEFEIEIDDEEIEDVSDIGSVVSLITKKTS